MFVELAGATAEAAVTKEEAKSPAKWTPPKCIIVPVVLKMADVDHQACDLATTLEFYPFPETSFCAHSMSFI